MTSEEYLSEILRVARENFQPSDATQSMTVARLGLLVRRVTGFEPEQCGFLRFKDALSILEGRGAIRTGFNAKRAFVFWLPDAPRDATVASLGNAGQGEGASKATQNERCAQIVRRLRGPLWFAFVGVAPAGRRFLNRRTGEIAVGRAESPIPPDEWVEIQPISVEEDKADASAFLTEEHLDGEDALKSTLESDTWVHDFVRTLHARDPSTAFRWKRRRSLRVIAQVEKWRTASNLPAEIVFEGWQRRESVNRSRPDISDREIDLRGVILAMLSGMSTEDLLDFRIPIRDAVAALRPDLLR